MKCLDIAIQLCDATFSSKVGSAHYNKHKSEFQNLTKKQYLEQAKQITESKQGKVEIQYTRKDGSKARYNLQTNILTIWYPKEDRIATHFKPKFDSKTRTVNTKESYEYVRNDMKKNGKQPLF